MRQSADMMGASRDTAVLADGARLRERLTEALQTVHQRNEIHITARELKATVSYVLFGLHDCEDLHRNAELEPHDPADFALTPNPLADRASSFASWRGSTRRSRAMPAWTAILSGRAPRTLRMVLAVFEIWSAGRCLFAMRGEGRT